MKLKIKFPTEKKGGPGSGHHGHSGRPGKHGGSLPGTGGGSGDVGSDGSTSPKQLLSNVGSIINENVTEDNITYDTIHDIGGDEYSVTYFGDNRLIERLELTYDGSGKLWLDNIQLSKRAQGKGISTRILDSLLSTTDKLYIHRPWNMDYWNYIQSKSKYKDKIIVVT